MLPSASLVPQNDPTLLFTNAGMNQFKDVFLGTGKRNFKRAANTQKCIRVSGKHNDLEEVGYDGYHHTFFEMLGNWSFGDYYKKEAIIWAWELLTEVWRLDKKRLWATVYHDDTESYELWREVTDIDPSHVLKFGQKDNFWEMGDTGPCGPCTEIHYDSTDNGCNADDINSNNPDVVELWNLVFIQFNRDYDGKLYELPERHVDTGMGFERLVRILQNKKSNYETDLFLPLINELIELTSKEYGGKYQVPMNVISDHLRALVFAISDGVLPSNEGRGYVLRRILRRAARYGRQLDMHKPFIYMLVDVLCIIMGDFFHEISEKKDFIKDVILSEEESFNLTLDRGIVLFNQEIEIMKHKNKAVFSGEAAFKLHDTYGFPLDLTQLMAREHGFAVDVEKFDELMSQQKERARAHRKDIINAINTVNAEVFQDVLYDPYNISESGQKTFARILPYEIELNGENKQVVVLKHNPFYSESGGQVSDTGELLFNGNKVNVYDSKGNFILTDIVNLPFSEVEVIAKLNYNRRQAIQRNHSATHLVHEALRRVLGTHVRQMGSYLDDKLLRFDFSHFHKIKEDEMKKVEDIVNEKISEHIKVFTEVMKLDEAKGIPNIKMFFGEKYSDEVRVVFIDDKFSVELCGGTHVAETSDIGFFKIIKEESVSSGARRILAYTGEGIIKYVFERLDSIMKITKEFSASNLKELISYQKLEDYLNLLRLADFRDQNLIREVINFSNVAMAQANKLQADYLKRKKDKNEELAKKKLLSAYEKINDLFDKAIVMGDVKIITAGFDLNSPEELKDIGDRLRGKSKDFVGLLYFVRDNKPVIMVVLGDDMIKLNLNAGEIVSELSQLIGGRGGGKAHMAQGGGKDVSRLNEAIVNFPEIIKKYLRR